MLFSLPDISVGDDLLSYHLLILCKLFKTQLKNISQNALVTSVYIVHQCSINHITTDSQTGALGGLELQAAVHFPCQASSLVCFCIYEMQIFPINTTTREAL